MRSCLPAALLLFVCACGPAVPRGGTEGSVDAGTPVFAADPLLTVTSDSGDLTLELRTDPQPPTRGTVAAEVTIHDHDGQPVDGLTLQVTPWMPAMGHGASVTPSVSADGAGRFVVRDIALFMPGTWELRIAVAGARTDHAVFSVAVP